MKDLFDKEFKETAPLADRIRPVDFDSFFGQEELVGENSPLRKIIQNDDLSSIIFWGGPGTGKTTLAKIIALKTKAYFVEFSAVATGVKDVRQAIEKAKERLKFEKQRTILFIDEIHRFNKAQQDTLLPAVEEGIVILIGATTENPSFEVISPLLSRSAVYILKPLSSEAIEKILLRALKDEKNGLGKLKLRITNKALERLINFADGDARTGLNGLEFVANYLKDRPKEIIKAEEISKILEKHALRYDKKGEEHYNLISALHKSLRDSNPDAALYWLMRMIESGEDPKFIARRMCVFASEDIGNADPQAIQIATAVAQAVDFVGLPEAQINLAQGITYLATAPKSNASYTAMLKAKEDAQKGSFGVPLHLRNAATSLMKKIGYGKGYEYAHDLANKKSTQIRERRKNEIFSERSVEMKAKLSSIHFPKEIGEKKYYNP